MDKRVPKDRMHNPAGGGYRKTQSAHKLRKDTKSSRIEDKIVRTGKLTLKDLRELCEEE